jgi:hypothetical protein
MAIYEKYEIKFGSLLLPPLGVGTRWGSKKKCCFTTKSY